MQYSFNFSNFNSDLFLFLPFILLFIFIYIYIEKDRWLLVLHQSKEKKYRNAGEICSSGPWRRQLERMEDRSEGKSCNFSNLLWKRECVLTEQSYHLKMFPSGFIGHIEILWPWKIVLHKRWKTLSLKFSFL